MSDSQHPPRPRVLAIRPGFVVARVPSRSTDAEYLVLWDESGISRCECPAFRFGGTGDCYHIAALEMLAKARSAA